MPLQYGGEIRLGKLVAHTNIPIVIVVEGVLFVGEEVKWGGFLFGEGDVSEDNDLDRAFHAVRGVSEAATNAVDVGEILEENFLQVE